MTLANMRLKLPPWLYQNPGDFTGGVLSATSWEGVLPSEGDRVAIPSPIALAVLETGFQQEPTLYWGKEGTLFRPPKVVLISGATTNFASYLAVVAAIGPLLDTSGITIATALPIEGDSILTAGQIQMSETAKVDGPSGSTYFKANVDPTSFIGGQLLVLADEEFFSYMFLDGFGNMAPKSDQIADDAAAVIAAFPAYDAYRFKWWRVNDYSLFGGGNGVADGIYTSAASAAGATGADVQYGGGIVDNTVRAAAYVAEIRDFFGI